MTETCGRTYGWQLIELLSFKTTYTSPLYLDRIEAGPQSRGERDFQNDDDRSLFYVSVSREFSTYLAQGGLTNFDFGGRSCTASSWIRQ